MKNSKNIRLIEFLIVIAVAFGSQIFTSVCIQLTGAELYYNNQYAKYPLIFFGGSIVLNLAIIALVIYLIIRQGRNLKELGFSLLWKDFIISIVLAFVAYIVTIFGGIILSKGYYMIIGMKLNLHPKNTEFLKAGINLWSVTAMLVNPFYEEIIVRCYIISEVKFLTNSVALALFLSVIIQSTYHLYQGFVPALLLTGMFTVFSLYYIKWQRIMPVILAHLYFDLIALFSAASH